MTMFKTRSGEHMARIAVLLMFGPLLLAVAVPAAAEPGRTDPRPIRAVVVVDESGSLTEEGVAAEKQATAIITQSEFSPKSQVAVVGFGSTTGQPNQTAVDVVCDMITVADGPSRDALAGCVGKLHVRSVEEGNDTDFAKAIGQAMTMLSAGDGPEGAQKVIFLLTDGKLDVSRSPEYGSEATRRNANALTIIDQHLEAARKSGVQIWPLGFGAAPDRAQLDRFAAGGSQETCGPQAQPPKARLVRSPSDVVPSLLDVFASARCASHTDTDAKVIGSGQQVDLKVRIPAITTDGSIAVTKRDKRIVVTYLDPDGKVMPKAGQDGDSTFQVSGENSPVEVLRIVDPKPGTWTVRLTSRPEVAAQDVSASVVWQGVVQSIISIDQQRPAPGEQNTVKVLIRSRSNALTDREALKSLVVGARLTGDGFPPLEVPLADDGKAPDVKALDGEYTGRIVVPTTATGPLRFLGSVGGPGLDVDERPLDTRIADPKEPLRTQVRLDERTVAPGGELKGTVAVNNTGGARKLRLVLDELGSGTQASVTPQTFDAPASGRSEVPFSIKFDARTDLGAAQARLRVVDDADPAHVYADASYAFDITYPPPWWERLWWIWVLVGFVIVSAVAVWLRWRAGVRAVVDVRGLTMQLSRDGRVIGKGVSAREEWADVFGFRIRDEDSSSPLLVNAPAEAGNYVVRRHPEGVVVQPPHGPDLILTPGRPKPLQNGWDLGYRDDRALGAPPSGPPLEPVIPHQAADPFASTPTLSTPRDDLFN
jgi:hypothetical protein